MCVVTSGSIFEFKPNQWLRLEIIEGTHGLTAIIKSGSISKPYLRLPLARENLTRDQKVIYMLTALVLLSGYLPDPQGIKHQKIRELINAVGKTYSIEKPFTT